MIVVADASPLVVLIGIGRISILAELFQSISIPDDVADEMASSKRSSAVRDFIATPPNWLTIRRPKFLSPLPGLHAGETAAIALALELSAERLLIVERRGRAAAMARGLKVVGTVGILEVAADMGLLDLRSAFEALKTTDFWISPKFLDERLARRPHEPASRQEADPIRSPIEEVHDP